MNRSSLFVAVVLILAIALLIFSPPLTAQEKPEGTSVEKNNADKGKLRSSSGKKADEDGPAPVIYFPEPLHDFGTISSGSKVSHNFKVVNNGDAPLRLIKAKGS